MSIRYSDDFKKEVVKAYMAGDKSTVQIAADYNIAKSTISQWVNQYKEIDQWYIDLSTIIKIYLV